MEVVLTSVLTYMLSPIPRPLDELCKTHAIDAHPVRRRLPGRSRGAWAVAFTVAPPTLAFTFLTSVALEALPATTLSPDADARAPRPRAIRAR